MTRETDVQLRDGGWIQECPNDPSHQGWSFASARAWLAVPLSHRREIVGFVVLDRPHHKVALDWEAFDLLRAAGLQAASYLAEDGTTETHRIAMLLPQPFDLIPDSKSPLKSILALS